MNTLIDLDTVKAAATALVADDPTRTNNGKCNYYADGHANCIAAVLVEELTDLDVSSLPNLPVYMNSAIYQRFTDAAADFLDVLQAHADNRGCLSEGVARGSWGLSLSGNVHWADALEGTLATNDPRGGAIRG